MLRRTKHSCAGSQVLKLSNCHVAQTDVWFISRPLILCLACRDVMWFAKLNGRAMEWMLLTVLTAHREEVYHRDNRLLTYISTSPGITKLHMIFVSFFANIMIRCFLWQSCSHLARMDLLSLLTLHFLHHYTFLYLQKKLLTRVCTISNRTLPAPRCTSFTLFCVERMLAGWKISSRIRFGEHWLIGHW